MTNNPFDQFSKQLFEAFLTPFGEVRINYEVPGVSRYIDILFASLSQSNTIPEELGMLSRIASLPCLLEPYSSQPTLDDVDSCLQKLLAVKADFRRQAAQEDRRLSEKEMPQLWIIAPTVSDRILNLFGGSLRSDWMNGIYFFVEGLRTAVIVVHRLPRTPETLLFRVLGRGKVQKQALREVLALPMDDNRRSVTLQLLSTWRISMDITGEVRNEDEELLMILSQAYQEWEQETKRQGMEIGMERGVERGQILLVENLLRSRFGELDEQLLAVIPSLLALPTEQYSALLVRLSNISREELLENF